MAARGSLRVYLGAAPGVGKTFAMLQEGARRASRGTDVVVGVVETHGRPQTEAQLAGLEVLPRCLVEYRGTSLLEFDLAAALERNPQVILMDELAHTNAPGSLNAKRYQDVEALLDAGIDVITTVNVQHLESLNDVVEQITGVLQREVVPDEFVRQAAQVHLVDQTPEALRRRLAHGNVYPAERVDAALQNYFRVGNLSALRELALMWVADRVDDGLQRYREQHGIEGVWETRERVVVAVTGAPGAPHVIRRAARIAARSRGELLGVHIRSIDGLGGLTGSDDALAAQRELLVNLGGRYREIGAADVALTLVEYARAEGATQIVLGASARSRFQELTRGSIINEVVRRSGAIDVHVVTPDVSVVGDANLPGRSRRRVAFSRRRATLGWVVALGAPPLLSWVLTSIQGDEALHVDLMLFTLVVTLTALVGGLLPALVAAVLSFLLVNWFFTAPVHTWAVNEPQDLLALVVFLLDAALIGWLVSFSARRATEANRARGDAATLAAVSGMVTAGGDTTSALLDALRTSLGAEVVAVVPSGTQGGQVPVVVSPPGAELTADSRRAMEFDAGPNARLMVVDATVHLDPAVFTAFLQHLIDSIERQRLRDSAEHTRQLEEANELRAGLLAAVSHDLRTPLAAVHASAEALLQPAVAADPEVRSELAASIVDQSERLHQLLTNLLEMSRIQAGAVNLDMREERLEEVLHRAVAGVDLRGRELRIDLDGAPPWIHCDPTLLERAIANLVDNAAKWSPPDRAVRIDAAALPGEVVIRVVDHGPGIPESRHVEVFRPFQRLDDHGGVEGTGLGLAVAGGFIERMGGRLVIDDTPGGGTTMSVYLPVTEAATL